jgi:predicted transcriptional regulator YdeE
METVDQKQPISVVGIELRTSNEHAFTTIPAHWQKFYAEAILDKISNRVSDDIYAVYTNFENEGKNNNGTYSLILGAQVRDLDKVPAPLVSTVIPSSKRTVFHVAKGQPEKVGEKWQEIWALNDLENTYLSDYEQYRENGEIAIFVGVK